jgi:hypothetical protein
LSSVGDVACRGAVQLTPSLEDWMNTCTLVVPQPLPPEEGSQNICASPLRLSAQAM